MDTPHVPHGSCECGLCTAIAEARDNRWADRDRRRREHKRADTARRLTSLLGVTDPIDFGMVNAIASLMDPNCEYEDATFTKAVSQQDATVDITIVRTLGPWSLEISAIATFYADDTGDTEDISAVVLRCEGCEPIHLQSASVQLTRGEREYLEDALATERARREVDP